MSAFAVAIGGKADMTCCGAYVRFWPKADLRVRRSVPAAYLWRVMFSVSHATLDPDRACSAALGGTWSLSKAAIRL